MKLVDLMESHHPWPVPLCFFTFLALRNCFSGALPPTVGHSFLLASSSPPNIDGPAFTAIRANCQVSNDSGNLSTSSNFSVSALLLSISPWVGGASSSGMAGSFSTGSSSGSACTSFLVLTCRAFLPSPILDVFFVLAILEKITS